MSDEDPVPAYARKLRAGPGPDRPLDGGAIAAGLCFGVLATFVAIAGPPSVVIGLGVTVACLLAGGVFAGYLARPTVRGGLQGIGVVTCTAGLMVAVAVSTSLGSGSPGRVPLVAIYSGLDTATFVAVLALTLVLGGLAGKLGARVRR